MRASLPVCDDVAWVCLESIDTDNECSLRVADTAFFSRLKHPCRRFFTLSAKSSLTRGRHAHKQCWQTFYLVCGDVPVELEINDGGRRECWRLMPDGRLLTVPPGLWVEVRFAGPASLQVFCSHDYAETDYIRNFSDFLQFRNTDSQ